MKIGIYGYGTVAKGVIKLLKNQATDASLSVFLRNPAKFDADEDCCQLASDPMDIAENADVVFEATCGSDGLPWTVAQAVLRRGGVLITANKAMVSEHLQEIEHLVETHKGRFYYEACVCGGIPLVKTLQDFFVIPGNAVRSIKGILNGSTNYLICECYKRTRASSDFVKDIIGEMTNLGYLEADPQMDLAGIDAAYKLNILSRLVFGISANQPISSGLMVWGVSNLKPADFIFMEDKGVLRLVGEVKIDAETGGCTFCVLPTIVASSSFFASIAGSTNAVAIASENLDTVTLSGPGAGMMATANSMISDFCASQAGRSLQPFSRRSSAAFETHRENLVIRWTGSKRNENWTELRSVGKYSYYGVGDVSAADLQSLSRECPDLMVFRVDV